MIAEAREQETLLTVVSSNIHILCQYLQMVWVCDTDQFSFLLMSDMKELPNGNTNEALHEERNEICQFNGLK